jgi:energy-coupling factor transport system ATP-binding protein
VELIKAVNLSYKYPISDEFVLKNLDFTIEKGKFYALLGNNGSGKTTLCNVLRGLIPHFHKGTLEGELLLEGKDIRDWELGDLAQKVGFVFQNPFTQISGVKDTVFEEIAYGLENLGVEVNEIRTRVQDIIDLLGIQSLADKNPFELSGGQKQRVALASIIVMNPEILVIDEPTSQLDPQGTEDIFKIIELMKHQGKTIILVEHKLELIAEYADWVLLLHDGEIVLQGDAYEVLSDESVLNFKFGLPQYSMLGIEMRKRGMVLDKIPVNEDQAKLELQKWLKEGKYELSRA